MNICCNAIVKRSEMAGNDLEYDLFIQKAILCAFMAFTDYFVCFLDNILKLCPTSIAYH